MLPRPEPWCELLQLCADDCDPATHHMQKVLLFGMSHSLFPSGVSVTWTSAKRRTMQQLFGLLFTTRSSLGPVMLPPNLQQDLHDYNTRYPDNPLQQTFFSVASGGDRSRRNSRHSRPETTVMPPAVWPLNPANPVRDTRIAITVLVEWYSVYQASPGVSPWDSLFAATKGTDSACGGDMCHTRSTRLMKVLDKVHAAALQSGLSDAQSLLVARQVLHSHILGDIALTRDNLWYYTNNKERQTFLLPPP
jgi:hypothetical protein